MPTIRNGKNARTHVSSSVSTPMSVPTQSALQRQSAPATHGVRHLPSTSASSSPSPHIPRPMNAFMLFRSHLHRAGVLGQQQYRHQNDFSSAAANVWNDMSEDDKIPWRHLALRVKEEHARMYPDYSRHQKVRREESAGAKRKKPRREVRRTLEAVATLSSQKQLRPIVPAVDRMAGRPYEEDENTSDTDTGCPSPDMFPPIDTPPTPSVHFPAHFPGISDNDHADTEVGLFLPRFDSEHGIPNGLSTRFDPRVQNTLFAMPVPETGETYGSVARTGGFGYSCDTSMSESNLWADVSARLLRDDDGIDQSWTWMIDMLEVERMNH